MSDVQHRNPRLLRHESPQEKDVRELLTETPGPPEHLIDNRAVYLRRHQIADFLTMDALHRLLTPLPGSTRWARARRSAGSPWPPTRWTTYGR